MTPRCGRLIWANRLRGGDANGAKGTAARAVPFFAASRPRGHICVRSLGWPGTAAGQPHWFHAFQRGPAEILQEVITLVVFVPFAVLYLDQPLKWDYLWASLCMLGAVYFIFRGA